jgi:hypothetical protein
MVGSYLASLHLIVSSKSLNICFSTQDTRKQLDYKNAYKLSFSFSESQRENVFFIPNEPIHIDIIGHEEEQALVLLHTNM